MTKFISVTAAVILIGVSGACSRDVNIADQQLTVLRASSVKTALMTFRIDVGDFPTTAEGLRALLEAPTQYKSKWKGPYIGPTEILDEWGTKYQYRYPGVKNPNGYDLWSFGADGIESADDLTNWQR